MPRVTLHDLVTQPWRETKEALSSPYLTQRWQESHILHETHTTYCAACGASTSATTGFKLGLLRADKRRSNEYSFQKIVDPLPYLRRGLTLLVHTQSTTVPRCITCLEEAL